MDDNYNPFEENGGAQNNPFEQDNSDPFYQPPTPTQTPPAAEQPNRGSSSNLNEVVVEPTPARSTPPPASPLAATSSSAPVTTIPAVAPATTTAPAKQTPKNQTPEPTKLGGKGYIKPGGGAEDVPKTAEITVPANASYEVQRIYADLQKKEQELQAHATKLKKREEEVLRRELALGPPPNFPVCYPLVYHNIGAEIRNDHARKIVRSFYTYWWVFIFALFWNFISEIAVMGTDETDSKSTDFALSLVYFLVGVPLSFLLWYYKLYGAAKKNLSSGYWMFFICFGLNLLFCVMLAIGIQSTGGAGWGIMIKMDDNDHGSETIMCMIAALLFTALALAGLWMYYVVIRHYKDMGNTLEKAQAEVIKQQAEKEVKNKTGGGKKKNANAV